MALFTLLACAGAGHAQEPPSPPPPGTATTQERPSTSDAPPQTAEQSNPDQDSLFRHASGGRLWAAAQVNVIMQEHDAFHAAYTGPNSLLPVHERVTSRLMTLFTGYQLSRQSEVLVDVERASGGGISTALGVAGFTNLDVVRNPTLSRSPYLARYIYHQVIPLSTETEKNDRNPLSVLPELAVRRFEFRIGKIGTVDFFDLNSVGSDSHLQFMNWAIDNNGAYDYMADTRGYTLGAIGEYRDGWWSVRGGVGLMPVVANGIKLDKHIREDRGQNLEFESRHPLIAGRNTTLRFLVYRNLARMGNYRDAIVRGELTGTAPDIADDDRPGRSKTGFGINIDQELNDRVRLFGRAGWNDGRNESFAYTEIDRSVSLGGDLRVPFRPHDRLGLAVVSSALSHDHRDYLAAGGLGFIIGDGALRYGHESILETYYTARIYRGLSIAGDLQRIRNPAFNRDRGPVLVRSLRLHIDL
jgi:high affinity Mn2+ porin